MTAAKALAWSIGKPLIGVDHVHGHLYSVMLEEGSGVRVQGSGEEASSLNPELRTLNPSFPAVGLVCSGGHTALYHLKDWLDVELIGTTIDDAVGEAYDKVAALLGLGYPGGPIIDRLAGQGDPKSIAFPRSLMSRESLDFSFSGLKTAVLYHVHGVPRKDQKPSHTPPHLNERQLADVAASFQAACVDVIVKKIRRAIKRVGAKRDHRRRRLRQPRPARGAGELRDPRPFPATGLLHRQRRDVGRPRTPLPFGRADECAGPRRDHAQPVSRVIAL